MCPLPPVLSLAVDAQPQCPVRATVCEILSSNFPRKFRLPTPAAHNHGPFLEPCGDSPSLLNPETVGLRGFNTTISTSKVTSKKLEDWSLSWPRHWDLERNKSLTPY